MVTSVQSSTICYFAVVSCSSVPRRSHRQAQKLFIKRDSVSNTTFNGILAIVSFETSEGGVRYVLTSDASSQFVKMTCPVTDALTVIVLRSVKDYLFGEEGSSRFEAVSRFNPSSCLVSVKLFTVVTIPQTYKDHCRPSLPVMLSLYCGVQKVCSLNLKPLKRTVLALV